MVKIKFNVGSLLRDKGAIMQHAVFTLLCVLEGYAAGKVRHFQSIKSNFMFTIQQKPN